MPAMPSTLSHLTNLSPGLLERAANLHEKDGAFRDWCEAHAICVRGVKRTEASRAARLHAEYSAQRARLEAELLRRLAEPRVAAAHAAGRPSTHP